MLANFQLPKVTYISTIEPADGCRLCRGKKFFALHPSLSHSGFLHSFRTTDNRQQTTGNRQQATDN